MEVVFLIPPATDVRSPHLAVPSLVAHLRSSGVRARARDLNLEGLLTLLEPEIIADAAQRCARRLDASSGDEQLRHLLDHAEFVVNGIGDALRSLRSPDGFYDPHRHHLARSCVTSALDLVSAASGRVRYNISPGTYEVDGVDSSRLADLAAVSADPVANLFDRLYRELVADLERSRPDVVGISILNGQQIVPGLMLARLLKAQGHFVVIGGTVYAKFADRIMRRPGFLRLFCDALVPYEGETALLGLLDQLAGGRDLARVPNLVHVGEDGRPVMGPVHIEDVDALPTPDFTCLPLDRYLSPEPVLPILTGKGCYFNRCKFCDIPFINSVSEKPYRRRAPALVASDVATLHVRHGARHFEMTDETLSPRHLLELAVAMEPHADVGARFVGYARLEPGFTPSTCTRLFDMGMRKLFFGLESGSQATLNHMRKGIRVEHARDVLRNCSNAGIAVHVFSIIGFPEEGEDSARATLGFLLDNADALEHPRNSFDIHPFGLDLRTEYADDAVTFAVEIDGGHLSGRDFPISVERWENTKGLGSGDVQRLLTEFDTALRDRYQGSRNYPDALWPGFEEYAVLYCDHYERHPFQYRFSLPPAGDPLPIRLVWADDVRIDDAGEGRFAISTLTGETVVGSAALTVLAIPSNCIPVDDLLETLASSFRHTAAQRAALVSELREVVDRLLGVRALWLLPRLDAGSAGADSAPDRAVLTPLSSARAADVSTHVL